MLIDRLLVVVGTGVGYVSWSTGYVPKRFSLLEELHKCPEAVFNYLCQKEEWELAEWVLDHFIH